MAVTTFSVVRQAIEDAANPRVIEVKGVGEAREGTLDPGTGHRTTIHETSIAVMQAVQVVVDALTPSGERYIASLANVDTAMTDLKGRRIIISSKPLRDTALSNIDKAVVMSAFSAHEIGHTRVTARRRPAIDAHPRPDGVEESWWHRVANIADDIVLEHVMGIDFPLVRDAFTVAMDWVVGRETRTPHVDTAQARFNAVLLATRYPEGSVDWNGHEVIRDWGRDWAERLLALRLTDDAGWLALVDEAAVLIAKDADPIWEPEPTGEPEEGEGEPDPDAEPGPTGTSPEEPEPEEGEADSEDESEDGSEDDDANEGEDGTGKGDEPESSDGPDGGPSIDETGQPGAGDAKEPDVVDPHQESQSDDPDDWTNKQVQDLLDSAQDSPILSFGRFGKSRVTRS